MSDSSCLHEETWIHLPQLAESDLARWRAASRRRIDTPHNGGQRADGGHGHAAVGHD